MSPVNYSDSELFSLSGGPGINMVTCQFKVPQETPGRKGKVATFFWIQQLSRLKAKLILWIANKKNKDIHKNLLILDTYYLSTIINSTLEQSIS